MYPLLKAWITIHVRIEGASLTLNQKRQKLSQMRRATLVLQWQKSRPVDDTKFQSKYFIQ